MQKSSKVIHVIADLGNGGAERQLIELLKRNPSHKLLVFRNTGIYKDELDANKVNYIELNVANSLSIIFNLLKIRKAIKLSNTSIIHAWMYNACFIISFIKFTMRIPHFIIWGIRCSNMDLKHYSFSLKLIIKLSKIFSFKTNFIIYNSYAGLIYHRKIGFSKILNKVIYNGINYQKFFFSKYHRCKQRKILGIRKNTIVIVCAARVDPMKNHFNLLKAFQKIRRKNKKVILLLLGKGTEQLDSQEGVIQLGMKLKIENYYSVGDMIILPSKFGEGFSNALAEGMSCQLFPLTTDVGDSLKIISNIGLVIKNSTIQEITRALDKALNIRKNELISLQKNSRKRILKEFNIKKMSSEYNKCYKELN